MRAGLIGCGKVFIELQLPAWKALAGVSPFAVCDPDEAAVQAATRHFPGARMFTNIDRMLDECRPFLDFISVATPGFTHYEIGRKVLDRGLHLLVEKPLALSLAEADDLRERAAKAKVLVCVAQTYRFRDSVLPVRRALADGQLGKVYQVDTTHHGESIFNDRSPWIWEERKHRVLLYEHAIHFLDLHAYFAGPVKQVLAVKNQIDEHLSCTTRVNALVEHTSGAIGNIDLQLFASSNYTHVEVFGTANDALMQFSPEGHRVYSGRVNPLDETVLSARRTLDFVATRLREKARPPELPRKSRPHYRLFSQFIEAVRDPSYCVPVSIDDVLPTMQLLDSLATY